MASHKLSTLPVTISNARISNSRRRDSSFSSPSASSFSIPLSSLFGKKLVLAASERCRFVPKQRRCSAVVNTAISPSAEKPESDSSDKLPKWSARAIKSYALAELEARKLKYPNTGTETLLMGILVEGTSKAARFLRENGITLFKVRDETINLLGKSDMYFFSPEHPPLTDPAQKAIDWAINERVKSGKGGEITTAHLLLGIWSQKESAGHTILGSLGFNDEKANELAKSIDDEVVLSFKKRGQ